MQFVQVKEARSPQTSQSGSAFGGGRADAADVRADAAAAGAAAGGGVVCGGDEAWRSAAVGDVPGAVADFFPPLFLDMVIVWCSDERRAVGVASVLSLRAVPTSVVRHCRCAGKRVRPLRQRNECSSHR